MFRYVQMLTLLLIGMINANQKRMIAVEFDGSSEAFILNVIKISKDSFKSKDEKHHYAIDPEVKVLGTHSEDKTLNETFIAHFFFDQILTADKLRYKSPEGHSFMFKLACDKPCTNEEICTVFGCQLKSLKQK